MSAEKNTLDALRIDRTRATRSRWPGAALVIFLFLAAIGGGAYWWFNQSRAVTVRTAAVQAVASGAEKTLLNASGYVTARREATVSSKVTGKVIEVMVEEGMKVDAGQVLARLDSSNVSKSLQLARAQLESAKRELGETKARLEQARRELDRVNKLKASNVASQLELDRAETEAKSLEARLERQAAGISVGDSEVALWEQQLDDTIIRAPFAGIVTAKNAQPGEMISPMSAGGSYTRTGICTVVDMASLEIEVDVSESYINRVEPGMPVTATLDSYPSWRIPAKVIAIIPTADRQKATVKVRIGFEKLDPRILPDMSVKAAFQSASSTTQPSTQAARQQGFTVPKAALKQRDGRDIVWVVRNNRAERRAVNIGETLGENVTIAAGLSGGERVVIEGADQLNDGVKVTEAKR